MPGPEALRERDLNRYYQPYRAAALQQPQYDKIEHRASGDNPDTLPLTYDGYKPQFTADRALTAFAQLACLRLNVRRAMVSLVDSKSQIILTEATRTLSLSRNTIDREDDRVWLGTAIIDREEGMCTNVVDGALYTATDPDGSTYTGEGFVVTDMSKDPRFMHREVVVNEPHMRFFAGVPIRSRNGYVIGSYGCSHNEVRPGLSISEFQFMQDMADTVMDHLEMIRDRDDRTKGERMVRGLAEFIEGSCTLGRASVKTNAAGGISTVKVGSDENGKMVVTKVPAASTTLERQTLNLKAHAEEDVDDNRPTKLDLTSQLSGPKVTKRINLPEAANPNCLFYRAADLIRKSTFADGVVFFRASGSSVHTKFPENLSSEDTTVDDSTSASDTGLRKNGQMSRPTKFTTQKPKKANKMHESRKFTDVLGLSVAENAPGEEKLRLEEFVFSEAAMDHYLRKFPHGKFFSFTKTGSGVSSGDDKSEVEPANADPVTLNGHKNKEALPRSSRRQKFIPTELLKILPAVRTLIFLPLWDSAAERWIAGGFIWTASENALTSPHNELPYLKAFGNSITSEYARMNALIADRAKSDFISSISHELRSPLHGILGSTEFLNESDISNYQAGLISSIETCSKTLLETLEHILDYAKINKLYTRDRNTRRLDTRTKHRDNGSSIMGPVRDDVDLNQILEEVSESVCAGHAFRETHAAPGHVMEDKPKVYTPCNLRHVSVSVEISPRLPYLVRTQPGAIRRIVMNLLGNALKYTNDGSIAVHLRAKQSTFDTSKTDVTMVFQDTGKGMSLEYQRTRLFSPFSQEDPFADGTGLGLSIVRQIVDSLGGHIDIQSKKNHGTTVEVHLSLPNAGELPTDAMSDALSVSAGKRIAVLCPTTCAKYLEACGNALSRNSREWFDVEIVEATIGQLSELKPDAILCPESLGNFEQLSCTAGIPIIVVCKNQTNQVALRKILLDSLPQCARDHFRIVAQPLGPTKLGQTFRQIFSQGSRAAAHSHHEHHDHNGTTNGMSQVNEKQDRPPLDLNPPPRAATFDVEGAEKEQQAARAKSDAQLPANKSKAPLASVFSPARPIPLRLKSGLISENPPRSHHILCVDDNAVNMRLLTMFMRKIGLAHSTAYHGLEALEKYVSCASLVTAPASAPPQMRRSSLSPLPDRAPPPPAPKQASAGETCTPPFTYVLMDISMPIMDGLEATRRIRAYEREVGIRPSVIVALTGLASAEAQRDALEAGVDFYLAKPVKFQDLRKLMEV